jgi:hypothetical protein
MRILFAFLVAVVVTVAFYFALQPYLSYEGAYKASMEALNVKLPRALEIRIAVCDCLAKWWYLPTAGIFSVTFAVLAAIGLTNKAEDARPSRGERPA